MGNLAGSSGCRHQNGPKHHAAFHNRFDHGPLRTFVGKRSTDPRLQAIIDQWPTLSEAEKDIVARIVGFESASEQLAPPQHTAKAKATGRMRSPHRSFPPGVAPDRHGVAACCIDRSPQPVIPTEPKPTVATSTAMLRAEANWGDAIIWESRFT